MMERILARALISAGLIIVAALLGLAAAGFSDGRLPRGAAAGEAWLAPAITGGVALLVALALAVVATGRREGDPPPEAAKYGRESAPR